MSANKMQNNGFNNGEDNNRLIPTIMANKLDSADVNGIMSYYRSANMR